jgi:hypothetical protein
MYVNVYMPGNEISSSRWWNTFTYPNLDIQWKESA